MEIICVSVALLRNVTAEPQAMCKVRIDRSDKTMVGLIH